MRNNINRFLFVIGAMLIATGCDDKLDLTDPQKATEGVVLSSDENVKAVLTGAYDALSQGSIFGGNTLRNGELLAASDEIFFSGTFTEPSEIINKSIITVNTNVADLWIDGYETINNANNVLSALEVVKAEDRDQVEGEALFIRGVTYFELVKFFGKPYSDGKASSNDGVPLVLTPGRGLDASSYVAREKVAKVYEQIVDDLVKATTLLPSVKDATRGSKESALAILSRVYLQMGDYKAARDAASAVIESKKFQLVTAYYSCFNGGTTTEDIFNIPVATTDGLNNMQLFYGATSYGGRGDIQIQKSHLDLYEGDDDRLALFYEDPSNGKTRCGKWKNQYGNVKIVRLAEMYLTRAEANFQLGEEVGATPLADINTIRTRVHLDAINAVDLDTILKERYLELSQEGHHIHDIKRLKKSFVEVPNTYAYDDDKLVFPVPQRERNVNKNLTQNAGYGNN